MGTRFVLVQHAEKKAEPGDPGLTQGGIAQAEAVAQRLDQLEVAAVYSSPMRRARETADRIAGCHQLSVTIDDRLRERMNWTGDEALDVFLADWARSTTDRGYQPGSGESSEASGERLEQTLQALAERHPDQTVVMIGHGGVTVDLARNLLGDEAVEALAPGIITGGVPNCAITEVLGEPETLLILRLADTSWTPTLPPTLRPVTDGVVRIRPPGPGEATLLVQGRDPEFHRWLGPGDEEPAPLACVEVDGELAGWVDYDLERDWLEPGEVNVGYALFPSHRHRGCATRAVQLLMHHLATRTDHRVATLLIDPDNHPSLALADRAGFSRVGDLGGQAYFKRPVPPLVYSDGIVSIRRPRATDLDADLGAKDEEQIRWLWLPGQRESWQAMSAAEQRAHAARGLQERQAAWGSGPKWTFLVDTAEVPYVAYVDCDLENDHVPHGEANISYSAHPEHRGKSYVSRAVRLVLAFLADHTGCRKAHIVVDSENAPSLRVPSAVGAVLVDCWTNESGRTMLRHVVAIPRQPAG
ncbi:MAG: GNAT family N-acetyltransferase [Acidimicrobiales bacterium]